MTDTIILRRESTVILLTLRTKGTAYSFDLSISYFLGECVCGLVRIMAVKPPSQWEGSQSLRVSLFLSKSYLMFN